MSHPGLRHNKDAYAARQRLRGNHSSHNYNSNGYAVQYQQQQQQGRHYNSGQPSSSYYPLRPQGSSYGHGHQSQSQWNNMSKSSIFVPEDWRVSNSKKGLSSFIGNIFKTLNKSSKHHGHHNPHGHGYSGHGYDHGYDHGYGHTHDSYSHHGSHYGRYGGIPPVTVASDNYGMFLHTLAMMPFHGGYAHVSSKSVPTFCPRCKKYMTTMVMKKPGAVHIAATVGAVILGIVLKAPKSLAPLALVPMQMKSLHDAIHYCSYCNYKLGKNVKFAIPRE